MWMRKFREKMEQAKRYVKLCTEVYAYQRKNGKYLLHEHPWLATSWDLECIAKIKNMEDVRTVQTHMCQFGMTARYWIYPRASAKADWIHDKQSVRRQVLIEKMQW